MTEQKEQFDIREAEKQDLRRIFFYWQAGYEEALKLELDPVHNAMEDRYKEEFQERLKEVDGVFKIWVAEQNEKIIGWQYLLPFENNPATRYLSAEVATYVHPDYRRSGVGTALLEYAQKHALQTPLQYVFGYISTENETMQRVASRIGFQKCGTIPEPEREPKHAASDIFLWIVPKN